MKKVFVVLTVIILVVVGALGTLYAIGVIGGTKQHLDTIDYAKKKSAESSAINFVDSVERTIMISKLGEEAITVSEGATYIVKNGVLKKQSGNGPDTIEVNFKGEKPTDGSTVVFGNDEKVSTATLTFEKLYDGTVIYPIAEE